VQDVADAPEVLLAIVVGHLEHRLLGALDDVARRAAWPWTLAWIS
jgi:hypothetical protein